MEDRMAVFVNNAELMYAKLEGKFKIPFTHDFWIQHQTKHYVSGLLKGNNPGILHPDDVLMRWQVEHADNRAHRFKANG